MAEGSSLQHQMQQKITTKTACSAAAVEEVTNKEPDLYPFECGPLSPPSPTLSAAFDDLNFSPNSPSASDKSGSAPFDSLSNSFFDDDEYQMNFVTGLFEPVDFLASNDIDRVFGAGSDGVNSTEDMELELGTVSDFGQPVTALESHSSPSVAGLRIVGMDSESDTEDTEMISGVSYQNGVRVTSVRCNNDLDSNEEFGWEEINERLEEVDNIISLIDRIEEISVSSEISSSDGDISFSDDGGEEDGDRNVEWQVLLARGVLEEHIEFESDSIGDEMSSLGMNGIHAYGTDYDHDSLLGQILEIGSVMKGSPPASKSVIESLPCVVITDKDLSINSVSCAVCKDEILIGEKVNKLPCSHYYHGGCIVPWLSIRNTCPVCRYELPTDDDDHWKNKNEEAFEAGFVNDLEV
ncbi:unnamed protein product [Cuscuta epithymum]|uniref:RING-type E3 ubiquitin transferase n=1 Tax=Cuscuta epithymum TaxID=186058 RepID=A0AAV0G6Q8_9ASTE|nr:unnamed protein product [Cuscuta epithymum]CAH9143660.1 unnamed protein product [Cuscuta epithymum]